MVFQCALASLSQEIKLNHRLPCVRHLRMAIATAATCSLSPSPAVAGEQTGRITSLLVRASDGLVSVELEGTHSAKPACATYNYWMIKAESTTTGKQQYAALLGAKLSGKQVRLIGSNQCTRWGDGEDIDGLYVLD